MCYLVPWSQRWPCCAGVCVTDMHLFIQLQKYGSKPPLPTITFKVILCCSAHTLLQGYSIHSARSSCGSRHNDIHEDGLYRCTCVPSMWRSCFDAVCTPKLPPACLNENQGACLACCSPAFPDGTTAECGENSVGAFCNSASVDEGVSVAERGLCSKWVILSSVATSTHTCLLCQSLSMQWCCIY